MNNSPQWLPNIVNVDGDWERIKERLYHIFENEIKNGNLKYNEKLIFYDRRILPGEEYEETFWHLTHIDWRKSSEQFDPRRSERLSWFAPVIRNSGDIKYVRCWDYKEGGKTNKINTYIWLEQFDYVIILQKKKMRKGDVYFLVSAHYLSGESRKRNLRNKLLKSRGMQTPP